MTKIVGLKEFRQNVEKYARVAEQGHSVVVVKRSKPMFRVESPEKDWETVIDFTKVRKGGVPADELIEYLSRHIAAEKKNGKARKAAS